ncbi:MAG: hypothetical protein E7212_15435 [Clostridium sartagoforme]|nr:hypothetical protein [Clostridium sartagoforme]
MRKSNRGVFEKANLLNLIVIIAASVFMSIQCFLIWGVEAGKNSLVLTIPAIIISFAFIRFVKNERVVGVAIPTIIGVASSIFIILNNGDSHGILILTCSIVLSTLYFDNLVLVIVSTINISITIILQLVLPYGILGKELINNQFYTHIVLMLISSITLYFLVKWGQEALTSAKNGEKEASLFSLKAQDTLLVVNSTIKVLDNSINNLETAIEITERESRIITNAINEINSSIENQSLYLRDIVSKVDTANNKISETKSTSEKLDKLSINLSEITDNNLARMEDVKNQMKIIEEVITDTATTSNNLETFMNNIISVLSGISNISKQTNLLALNASIEAARAGENGKGLAVVASEIRKLSMESSKITEEIEESIREIIHKTKEISNKAQEGKNSINDGIEIVDITLTSYNEMYKLFNNIKSNIRLEFENIEDINLLFKNIKENINVASDISNNQVSNTKGILKSQVNQQKQIESITNYLEEVKNQSKELGKI